MSLDVKTEPHPPPSSVGSIGLLLHDTTWTMQDAKLTAGEYTSASELPLLHYSRSSRWSYSAIPRNLSSHHISPTADLLSFLAIVQASEIDMLPIQWQPALDTVGEGATAEIRQLYIDIQTTFVFKRFRWTTQNESSNYRALMCEVSILGHRSIRSHPNILRLEGICWDINLEDKGVWPVLVFEKGSYGDLRTFVDTNAGRNLRWDDRIKLCADIAAAMESMHSCRNQTLYWIQHC